MQINPVRLYQFLLLICLVLACLPMEWVMNDSLTDMLKVTLSVYALSRSLNAVISVAQGTKMSIEPMGVGLTLAPGEILDPLNDLIEQFSDVLLFASASLGIQQIVLILADKPVVRILLGGLVILSLVLISFSKLRTPSRHGLVKLVLLLTLLRLVVPVMGLASYQLQGWLIEERTEAVRVLEDTQEEVAVLNHQQDKDSGWFGDLRRQFNIEAKLVQMTERTEQGVQAALYLLAEFVLLMLILPLLFLWILMRFVSALVLK